MKYIFILLSINCFSQDTVKIYFDFGSAKIDAEAGLELASLSSTFDLSNLDSIQFIGYADSVGNLNSNWRLSNRRAKNAFNYCKNSLDKKVGISILARGEGVNIDPSINRRVDLILHFHKSNNDGSDQSEGIIEAANPRCFFIDYEALGFCHIRTIQKRKKNYTYIEAINHPLISDSSHYYVSDNSPGSVTIKKIKWKKEKTGILWWKKTRLVTTLQGKDFDKYKMFTLENAPCNGCKESVFTTDTVFEKFINFYPQYFLMDNMQVKARIFARNQIKIRVPREYVDLNETYYLSESLDKDKWGEKILWTTKRGKRNRNYFFSKVESYSGVIPYIKTQIITMVCKNTRSLEYSKPRFFCMFFASWNAEFQLNIEPGIFYHNDTLTGFFVVGLSAHNYRSNVYLQGGLNFHSGFYGSLRYQFHFLTFPLTSLSLGNSWKDPSPTPYNFNHVGRFYIGAEMRTSYNKKYLSFLESNLHLGFSYFNLKIESVLSQIYLHGGIAKDLTDRINSSYYPYIQLGMTVNLFNLRVRVID